MGISMGYEEIVFQYGPLILGAVLAWVVRGWKDWKDVKQKITEFKDLVGAVDDAIYDDAVSETEFRNIWEKAKALFNK